MPRCSATSIPISHAPKNRLAAPLAHLSDRSLLLPAESSFRALVSLLERRIAAERAGILSALPERAQKHFAHGDHIARDLDDFPDDVQHC